MTDEILAHGNRRNNAEAIRDAAQLGHLRADLETWDGTYRTGRFWKLWQPNEALFCRTDLDPQFSPSVPQGVDATDSGWADGEWPQVVLDGPYKLNGTPDGGGPATGDDSYGVGGKAVRWQDRMALLSAMLREGERVLAPKGVLLFKCQAQVVSGQKRWQDRIFANEGEALGLRLVDMLHVAGYRRQPAGRRQLTARSDYSTLLIFRKPK